MIEVTEKRLRLLGFNDFVHLAKDKRDGKNRLVSIRFVSGEWLTIIVVGNIGYWEIEKIIYDGNDEGITAFIQSKPDIESTLERFFN